MDLHKPTAEIYVPDGSPVESAISRATHIAVGAHQDDIEIMAYHGIAECYDDPNKGFMGVVVTDGAGSPRAGVYADRTDAEMREIRRAEQKKAARIGHYVAQVLLDYPSAEVKNPANENVIEDIAWLISSARPEVVYTHNLADKHDTHVAVALRTIEAIRTFPMDLRPAKLYGCEVWRDLDWLTDDDKVPLDVSAYPDLAKALLAAFDSQISGGKRYDLATLGRRHANATYMASHAVDTSSAVTFAMDLTPLVEDDSLDIGEYAQGFVGRFAEDVVERLRRLR